MGVAFSKHHTLTLAVLLALTGCVRTLDHIAKGASPDKIETMDVAIERLDHHEFKISSIQGQDTVFSIKVDVRAIAVDSQVIRPTQKHFIFQARLERPADTVIDVGAWENLSKKLIGAALTDLRLPVETTYQCFWFKAPQTCYKGCSYRSLSQVTWKPISCGASKFPQLTADDARRIVRKVVPPSLMLHPVLVQTCNTLSTKRPCIGLVDFAASTYAPVRVDFPKTISLQIASRPDNDIARAALVPLLVPAIVTDVVGMPLWATLNKVGIIDLKSYLDLDDTKEEQ